jgi:Ankyrin repeats (3 copies)
MSRPDPDDRPDDLTERYRAASAQDPARPSDAIRQSIFAHARMVAADQTVERTRSHGTRRRAANDPSWRLAIAASVLVTGLATVLAWHFHARGPVPGQRPHAASWDVGADKHLAAAPQVNGPVTAAEPLPAESKASNAPAANAVTARSRQRLVAQAESPYTPHNGASRTAHDETAASKLEAGSATNSQQELASVAVTAERNADLARNAEAAGSESESPISSGQTAAAPAIPPSTPEARRSAAPGAAASDRAKAQSDPPLITAAESGDLAQIEQLLRGGASPEQADARGRTALLIATLRADLPMVRRLLTAGARADTADANGDTPLAVARRQGSPELIHMLERGTQP